MTTQKRDEAWMDYLRECPQKAKKLIKEAQRRSIADIEEKYSDVLTAYSETKNALDGVVAELAALRKSRPGKPDSVIRKAYERSEKEWDRLSYEFHLKHGARYDAYEQEVAACKASFNELRSLLLV
jgi:hypothetical protein